MKKLLLPTLLALCVALTAHGADENFIDLSALDAQLPVENGATVAVENGGIKLTFPESKSYPGFDLRAPNGTWDLSAFGGVAIDVSNEGGTKVGVSVRVENGGDWKQSPWNAETQWINAGSTGTITVNFGQSFGKPGFALDPAAVTKIKVFVNTPGSEGSVVVRGIHAIAKP